MEGFTTSPSFLFFFLDDPPSPRPFFSPSGSSVAPVFLARLGQPSFFHLFQCSSRCRILFTDLANSGPRGGVSSRSLYIFRVDSPIHLSWSLDRAWASVLNLTLDLRY